MLKPRDIYKQIKVLTTDVISSGLCEAENYPSMKKRPGYVTEIGITGVDNAVFLKSIPYVDMYQTLLEQRHFNMKMIDGALLTMQYRFVKDRLSAHRLSYFPAPNLEAFQNDPELYLHDGIYADILDRRIVPVPFRFDYDNDEKTYQPVEHPISHLTLGQYKNCRIPVSSALTPYLYSETSTTLPASNIGLLYFAINLRIVSFLTNRNCSTSIPHCIKVERLLVSNYSKPWCFNFCTYTATENCLAFSHILRL